jgi:hypothetical protein
MSCVRGKSTVEWSSFPGKSSRKPGVRKSPHPIWARHPSGPAASVRFILDVSDYYVILAITIRTRPVDSGMSDRGYRVICVFEGKKTKEVRLPRNAHPESSTNQKQPIP